MTELQESWLVEVPDGGSVGELVEVAVVLQREEVVVLLVIAMVAG